MSALPRGRNEANLIEQPVSPHLIHPSTKNCIMLRVALFDLKRAVIEFRRVRIVYARRLIVLGGDGHPIALPVHDEALRSEPFFEAISPIFGRRRRAA